MSTYNWRRHWLDKTRGGYDVLFVTNEEGTEVLSLQASIIEKMFAELGETVSWKMP